MTGRLTPNSSHGSTARPGHCLDYVPGISQPPSGNPLPKPTDIAPPGKPGTTESDAEVEIAVCRECGRRFERMPVRGLKIDAQSTMPHASEAARGDSGPRALNTASAESAPGRT